MQKKEKTGKAKEKKPKAAHAEAPKKIKAHAHKEEHNKGITAQPEINIGMIGHVDHGKCIATDELVLLNNELSDGSKIIGFAKDICGAERVSESERVFEIPNFKTFSLSADFQPISVNAKLFVQNYSGKMVEVETKRGKRIKISPKHPLLVNDGRDLVWKNSETLKVGDFIASVSKIPCQDFIRDFSPNWIQSISKNCWVVSKQDFEILFEKTKSFSEFTNLSMIEINKLRVLLKKSVFSIEKELGISGGELSHGLKFWLTNRQERLITDFFKKQSFKKPAGLILNFKENTQSFCEILLEDYWNDDALRFLALVTAEGCLTESSTRFSQENNELCSEFLKSCENLFEVKPKFYPPFDYQINNKALVCFLQEKYGLKIGNSRRAGIPEWVFTLPNKKTAVFLNAFFSAEANFNQKSNQIALIQANKRSIEIISYCLKKFGIPHSIHEIEKCATNGKNIKRQYWQLLISGTKNIAAFRQNIDVSLPSKQKILEKMCHSSGAGKKSDEMIPLDFVLFSKLVENLGFKKKKYSKKTKPLKKQGWIWAFQDCRLKNAISRENFAMFSGQCGERILLLEKLGESVNENCLTEAMAEIGISQEQLGSGIDLSQKQVFTILRSDKTERKQKLVLALKVEIKRKVADSKRVFGQILKNSPENIEWDKIKSIKEMKYFGPIIDLQVPGYYNFIAGLGGIVSHNTSLTKALTGKWCDTHSEEMKRGISIRLGYADTTFYKLKTNNGIIYSNDKNKGTVVSERLVSFVDAPGHETLMTTMLSGAALMNGAVLVIAANEICPQPRTVEHLMALKFAGVEKIVVAQNKVDLVDAERAKQQQGEIKKFLKEYGYENAPIIPTVANFGTNIDYLIEAIETRIPTPKYELNKGLKMFVARSFDINRPGTKVREMKGAVVGGSITQGKIKLGDEVQLYPGIKGKTITKVISLATDSGMLNEAVPGGLIAVGTEIDPSMGQNDRLRGQIVGKPGSMPEPTKVVLLKLNPFERVVATDQKAEIKSNDIIVLTIGTNTAIGTAAQSAGGKVIVSLKNEVVAEKGEKVAVSKNLNNQWRLVAYGEVL